MPLAITMSREQAQMLLQGKSLGLGSTISPGSRPLLRGQASRCCGATHMGDKVAGGPSTVRSCSNATRAMSGGHWPMCGENLCEMPKNGRLGHAHHKSALIAFHARACLGGHAAQAHHHRDGRRTGLSPSNKAYGAAYAGPHGGSKNHGCVVFLRWFRRRYHEAHRRSAGQVLDQDTAHRHRFLGHCERPPHDGAFCPLSHPACNLCILTAWCSQLREPMHRESPAFREPMAVPIADIHPHLVSIIHATCMPSWQRFSGRKL